VTFRSTESDSRLGRSIASMSSADIGGPDARPGVSRVRRMSSELFSGRRRSWLLELLPTGEHVEQLEPLAGLLAQSGSDIPGNGHV
jgi:hypothetical protein